MTDCRQHPALATRPRGADHALARFNRLPLFTTVSLILLIAVVTFWTLGSKCSVVCTAFSPAGHWQGIASDRHGLVLFLSDVPCGREYGCTVDAAAVPSRDIQLVGDYLFQTGRQKWRRWGFALAGGTFDPTFMHLIKWRFGALMVPYWAILLVVIPLPLQSIRRAWLHRRRKRRGACANCGFDLRASPVRCPECATPVDRSRTQRPACRSSDDAGRAPSGNAREIEACAVREESPTSRTQ
jgi:hypothetical protein